MDMQTKIMFELKYSNDSRSEMHTIDVNNDLFPDRNLGNNVIVFTEHRRVTVTFDSQDNNAYLEIECYSKDDVAVVKPGESILISPGQDEDDMMIPGYYSLTVYTSGVSYNGMFKVNPSSISWDGLINMRNYLENIYEGLSHNLYIRRLGKQGNSIVHNVFLIEIYNHIINYQDTLLNFLNLIVKSPITNIIKEYKEQVYSLRPDKKSQRWLSLKGAYLNRNLYFPEITYEKHAITSYINMESKWVRKILHHTIQVLSELNNKFSNVTNDLLERKNSKEIEYNNTNYKLNNIIDDYTISKIFINEQSNKLRVLYNEIEELKKNIDFINEIINNIKKLKSLFLHYEHDTWLNEISDYEVALKPSTRLLKDYRYSSLFYFYQELNNMEKNISSNKKTVFPSKKTSKLFEYYTIVLIIKILEDEYGYCWNSGWIMDEGGEKFYNGEIPSGTVLVLKKDNLLCEIAYDLEIEKWSGFRSKGYFVRNNARSWRPDIRIAQYNFTTGELLNTIIVEVKCRRSKYLYNDQGDTAVIDQLNDYYQFGFYDVKARENVRGVVKSIIVVYPKQNNKIAYKGADHYSFIQIEPADHGVLPYGYDELKQNIGLYYS